MCFCTRLDVEKNVYITKASDVGRYILSEYILSSPKLKHMTLKYRAIELAINSKFGFVWAKFCVFLTFHFWWNLLFIGKKYFPRYLITTILLANDPQICTRKIVCNRQKVAMAPALLIYIMFFLFFFLIIRSTTFSWNILQNFEAREE